MGRKLKVLLVGNYTADAQYSMLGFFATLARELPGRELDVSLTSAQPVLGSRTKRAPAGLRKWIAYIDKYLLYPKELVREARNVDIVHICDQGNGIYLNYLHQFPHLLNCHDVLAIRSALGELPEWKTGASGRIYQKLILNGIRKAKKAAAISEATRQDVHRIAGLPMTHISLTPMCLFRSY